MKPLLASLLTLRLGSALALCLLAACSSISPAPATPTVVHEVGHQWFYNLVGNDQLDKPWLDESLAQYVTWQYYEVNFGAGAGDGSAQFARQIRIFHLLFFVV